MTMTDSQPPTVAGPPANQDTAAVLAWALDDPNQVEPAGRWGPAVGYAVVVVSIGAVIAAVIAVVGLLVFRSGREPQAPAVAPLLPYTAPVVSPPIPAPSAPPVWKTAEPPPPPVTRPSPPMAPPPPAPAAPAQAELDNRYLADLTAGGLQITDVPAVLAGAHEVCQYLAAGHTETDTIVLAVHNNPLLSTANARTMVEAAIDVYCPSYG